MAKAPVGDKMSGVFDDTEKKKKKKAEELKIQDTEKLIKSQKQKEKIRKSAEANAELSNLKDLVEKGVVSEVTVKRAKEAAKDTAVDTQETREMLGKIEDLQENEYMKKYIPEDLFLSKDEYIGALKDPKQRAGTLQKVDEVLGILAQHINPTSRAGINIFSSFAIFLLDKNLIRAQEDHIDIKYALSTKK